MAMQNSLLCALIVILSVAPVAADPSPSGTKGQNYDRIVFETQGDEETSVVVRIMTLNRLPTSASTIVVTHNGQPVLGPERLEQERWTRTISIKGAGRHEIVATCGAIDAEPVYCSLRAENRSASLAQ